MAYALKTLTRICSDYMAYFNEFVGGPMNGIEYLADCNIDWGENLKRIKRYRDEHQFEKVKLFYSSTGRPEYYGIHAKPKVFACLAQPPEPGIYIFSANTLIQAKGYLGID